MEHRGVFGSRVALGQACEGVIHHINGTLVAAAMSPMINAPQDMKVSLRRQPVPRPCSEIGMAQVLGQRPSLEHAQSLSTTDI